MKTFKFIQKRIWEYLPYHFRNRIVQKTFKLDPKICEEFVFKPAETKEDFEQAFQLLYLAYLERSLTEINDEEMYTNIYQALPFTHILVAKKGDRVAATVSLVRDSEGVGLPSDSSYKKENDQLRQKGKLLCEVSGLAVGAYFRRRAGFGLIGHLMVYLYLFIERRMDVTTMCLTAHPKTLDFYRSLFDFQITGDIKTYHYVKGAPAIHLSQDISIIREYCRTSRKNTASRKIYDLYSSKEVPYYFPKTEEGWVLNFNMTPQLLKYFFQKKTGVFGNVKTEVRKDIKRAYSIAFEGLSDIAAFSSLTTSRPFRYPVKLNVVIEHSNSKLFGKIMDLSWRGASLKNDSPLKINELIKLQFELNRKKFKIMAKVVRLISEDNSDVYEYGVEFLKEEKSLKKTIATLVRNR